MGDNTFVPALIVIFVPLPIIAMVMKPRIFVLPAMCVRGVAPVFCKPVPFWETHTTPVKNGVTTTTDMLVVRDRSQIWVVVVTAATSTMVMPIVPVQTIPPKGNCIVRAKMCINVTRASPTTAMALSSEIVPTDVTWAIATNAVLALAVVQEATSVNVDPMVPTTNGKPPPIVQMAVTLDIAMSVPHPDNAVVLAPTKNFVFKHPSATNGRSRIVAMAVTTDIAINVLRTPALVQVLVAKNRSVSLPRRDTNSSTTTVITDVTTDIATNVRPA